MENESSVLCPVLSWSVLVRTEGKEWLTEKKKGYHGCNRRKLHPYSASWLCLPASPCLLLCRLLSFSFGSILDPVHVFDIVYFCSSCVCPLPSPLCFSAVKEKSRTSSIHNPNRVHVHILLNECAKVECEVSMCSSVAFMVALRRRLLPNGGIGGEERGVVMFKKLRSWPPTWRPHVY